MCTHSPAGQPCPGPHPQQHGYRAREGILLVEVEAPSLETLKARLDRALSNLT